MNCYFCQKPISGSEPVEDHHPDREHLPDWTEPAHAYCHRKYHQEQGHFAVWGGRSSTAGYPGYRLVLKQCPLFHRLGGLARARSARRNPNGTFAANTQ